MASKRLRDRNASAFADNASEGDAKAGPRRTSDAETLTSNPSQDRRGSRPKAPWPLDTLFGHGPARTLFGGGASSSSKKDDARTRSCPSEDGRAHSVGVAPDRLFERSAPREVLRGPERLSPAPDQAPTSAPIAVHPPNRPSSDLSDLPATPPDSVMMDVRLAEVASLGRQSYTGPEGKDSFSRFVDRQEGKIAPISPVQTSPTKPQSKNDIFNSRSVWTSPAPPPPPARALAQSSALQRSREESSESMAVWAAPPAAVAALPRTASKTSAFFSSAVSPVLTPPSSAVSQRLAPTLPCATTGFESSAASTHGPASVKQSDREQTVSEAPERHSKGGHSRKASLGRANSEEREQEQARIRQTNKDVEFRLCPSREFLLGEGRHCNVFLGSYYSKRSQKESSEGSPGRQSASLLGKLELRIKDWKLCAIKRLHADRQSQLLGLDEAFALRRLGPHPNIIRLIDIRDEVEFTPSPQPSPRVARAELGKGLPGAPFRAAAGRSANDGGQDEVGSPSTAHSAHGRSTSDMTGRAEVLTENRTLKLVIAAQKEVEAANSRGIEIGRTEADLSKKNPGSLRVERRGPRHSAVPLLQVAPPSDKDSMLFQRLDTHVGDDLPHDAEAAKKVLQKATSGDRGASTSIDTPRLLILLELLPNSLANFTRLNPDRVDLEQWQCWAFEMSSAVAWLHERGCIHADLKKENMLLTDDLSIKLCDFNSAVFPVPGDPPTDGMGLGTPAYGAPELSRATGGPGASSFSFPIDIYSLGAVLYSLATGVEPFSNARSVVEILQRKKAFFEAEENSRADRLVVEAGSNPASSVASRSNSIRGRRKDRPDDSQHCISPGAISRSLASIMMPGSPSLGPGSHRNASTDSLESVASSITTMGGRNPSAYAVARLLDPSPEPSGLLMNENETMRKGLLSPAFSQQSGVERRASMGRLQQRNAASALRLRTAQLGEEAGMPKSGRSPTGSRLHVPAMARPDVLRRASSFGDGVDPNSQNVTSSSVASGLSPPSALPARIDELSSPPMRPSALRTTVTQTDLDNLDTPTHERGAGTLPPWLVDDVATTSLTRVSADASDGADRPYLDDEQAVHEDLRPYADGLPALILPGGGRLPDEARELIRNMVRASPQSRPVAREVCNRLDRLA